MRGPTESPITFRGGCVSRNQSRIPNTEEVLSCFPKDQADNEALQFYWRTFFPAEARNFFHATLDNLSLLRLVEFWGRYAPFDGSVSNHVYGASWYLAFLYMVRNEQAIARSLTINGALIQEIHVSSCISCSFCK